MKKKIFGIAILIMLFIPLTVFAHGGDDDTITPVYNVKCEYDLIASLPIDSDAYLTTISVYVDETNSKYKMTYLNKNSEETVLNGNVFDYKNSSNISSNYFLQNWDPDFDIFDYHYKNDQKKCPDMYVYTNYTVYSVFPTFNQEYANNPYKRISVTNRYSSNDNGSTWQLLDGNISSDDITLDKECTYNFLSDFGIKTIDPMKIDIKFFREKNNTTGEFIYNLSVSGDFDEYNYNNILTQTIFPLGNFIGINDDFQLYISEDTIRAILDGDGCLSKENVYSYRADDRVEVHELVITSNYEEANEETIGGIYDGGTGEETPDLNLGEEQYGCDVVPEVVRKWIKIVLNFVKYVALVLVIVLGTIDFIKASAQGESDSMKKAGQASLKRVIAVILLFLLPMLVEFILNLINLYGSTGDCFEIYK